MEISFGDDGLDSFHLESFIIIEKKRHGNDRKY